MDEQFVIENLVDFVSHLLAIMKYADIQLDECFDEDDLAEFVKMYEYAQGI